MNDTIRIASNRFGRASTLASTLVRLFCTAAPLLVMTAPGAACAATVENTARIAAPAGAFETNTANNEATDSDTLLAVMVAANDSATGVNGLVGAAAVANAFANDTVNGTAASAGNATLAVASGSSVPAGLTFDTATGDVSVVAGTAAGTYGFDYRLCEKLNPTNCVNATISVTVVAATIAADADTANGIDGAAGAANVVDVLAGDTLGGAQVTLSQVNLTVETPASPASPGAPVPALDVATGQVSVPANTPAGTYTITYKICEKLNAANCAINTATIAVSAATIVATNDSAAGINGLVGASAVVNAFTGDTVNGAAATSANATLALAAGSTLPAGIAFDTATGDVSVAAGTAAGAYSFDYTLCEKLNPTNCQTATISLTVVAAAIAADADSVSGLNGVTGGSDVLDVLAGDTLGGSQVLLSQVTLTVQTAATPASSGAPVPALDVATGKISVPVNTPAGTYTITYKICENLNAANCATNTATVGVNPSVDLAITKSNGGSSVFSGAVVNYTLVVTNNGPDAATGAVVTDTPGAGLTCPAANPVVITGSGVPSGSFTLSQLTGSGITLGTLGNGQSATITYSCTVN